MHCTVTSSGTHNTSTNIVLSALHLECYYFSGVRYITRHPLHGRSAHVIATIAITRKEQTNRYSNVNYALTNGNLVRYLVVVTN